MNVISQSKIEDQVRDDLIEQRENELYGMTFDFITDIIGDAPETFVTAQEADEVCQNVLDMVCEYIFTEYGLSPYRPMMMVDEQGNESFEEFPYEYMELEDS